MDWWDRFKKKLTGGETKVEDASGADAPTWILALCASSGVSGLRVMISDVRPTGLTFASQNAFQIDSQLTLSVPIGVNFATTESQEFVRIQGHVVRCNRGCTDYETEVRFTDRANERRDRWIASMLGAYGVTIPEPNLARASDRRGGTRYATSLAVRVQAGEERLGGYVRNLSLGGMLALVDGELPVHRDVVLELDLPAAREALRVSGRVVHREAGVAGAFSVIGVAFESLTPQQGDALTRGLVAVARQVSERRAH